MAHDLKTFLKPHCVAIIGASRDASKRGNRAIQMLLDSKFGGRIIPINPKESEILALPCYIVLAASGCRRYLLAAFPHFKPLQRYNRCAARVTRAFAERYMASV